MRLPPKPEVSGLPFEELVGRAIKGYRDGYVIATKFARRIDGRDAGRHVHGRSIPEGASRRDVASLRALAGS